MRWVPGNRGWGGSEIRRAWRFGEKKEGQSGCHWVTPQGARAGSEQGPGGWVVRGHLSFILHALEVLSDKYLQIKDWMTGSSHWAQRGREKALIRPKDPGLSPHGPDLYFSLGFGCSTTN